jgi:hypothetical protein
MLPSTYRVSHTILLAIGQGRDSEAQLPCDLVERGAPRRLFSSPMSPNTFRSERVDEMKPRAAPDTYEIFALHNFCRRA